MELNINSPAYFTREYGVDDEVYAFCRRAYSYFKDKEYSDTVHTVGVMPAAAPQELYDSGAWEESLQLVSGKRCAIISVRMDFEEYRSGDSAARIALIKEAVLKKVKNIRSRARFDFKQFELDFSNLE